MMVMVLCFLLMVCVYWGAVESHERVPQASFRQSRGKQIRLSDWDRRVSALRGGDDAEEDCAKGNAKTTSQLSCQDRGFALLGCESHHILFGAVRNGWL